MALTPEQQWLFRISGFVKLPGVLPLVARAGRFAEGGADGRQRGEQRFRAAGAFQLFGQGSVFIRHLSSGVR